MHDAEKLDTKLKIEDSAGTVDPYQEFFEKAADGMFITNPQRQFQKANRQWLAMTGYSEEDLANTSYPAMILPEELEQQPLLVDTLQQGRLATKERWFLRKDGSRFQAEIRSRMIADGNILSIARDITEKKRAEAKAEERTRELAALQALGLVVSSSLSLDQVGKAAMAGMLTAVRPDLAYLFLRDGDKLLLKEIAPPEARLRLSVVPEHRVGECMCGLSVQEEKSLYSRNIHTDSRCTWDECKEAGIQSFATLPLRNGQEIIGVIGLASMTDRDFEIQAGFLETLAHQVSLALANARNYEAAQRELSERENAEKILQKTTAFLEQAFKQSPIPMVLVSMPDAVFRIVNPACLDFLGMSDEPSLVGTSLFDFRPPFQDFDTNGNLGSLENLPLARALRGEKTFNEERRIARKDGTIRWELVNGAPIVNEQGEIIAGYLAIIDNTERKLAEAALLASEKKARAIFERSPVGIILLDSRSTVLDCNEHFAGIFEVPRERYLGIKLLDHLPDGSVRRHLLQTMRGEGTYRFEDEHTSIFSGKTVFLSIISEKIGPDLIIVVMTDISEQKKAAQIQQNLQEQLLQAQKMESVGRLAGGVAHDFNNMLTAILGHAELAKGHCRPADPISADLQVIDLAARRSADLVRQLLAFARRQTVIPKILDLNDCVAGLLRMLVRLIGEDIDLVWKPGAEVWPIKIDPSQVDQLLANLCVNARDAIEGVGKITIATKNMAFDSVYCDLHPAFIPGEYVVLSVSDDGVGIDKSILEHIFEPFFTTKEVGKGTGLGLSTVYGIAKQNQGFVDVNSVPGKGTSFMIYLPRFAAAAVEPQAQQKTEIPRGNGQTVLLVEDEEVILNVGKAMLDRLGYKVLAATSPREAIRAAEAHTKEIELLITDVIMPEMNGRDVAQILAGIIPGLKCLFTSGYTADIIAVHGVLDENINFIQKPFSFQQLAVKVFEVLQDKTA